MAFTSTLLPLATPGTQYTGSSADTSDSGGDTGVSGRSCGLGRQGVRTVTLCRRHDPVRQSSALGFSLRGGREHGTGFFVSAVERGSEAFCQGLKVGDQIIRINGFPVEDATHREVLHLIQNQNNIRLKVRSVGMIPVKDSYNDTLTWQIVEPDVRLTVQQPPCHNECYRNSVNNLPCEDQSVAKLIINVAPKAKLGCGICKGPDWKPGIFVQFTKENGLARNAGLRPGDQIVQCNNVTFTPETPFSEAVSVLRSSGLLELIIRKGAGLDLFPGESSGYNSSASSIAGDQSPETWPNKRLSIVKEESVIDSESRLSQSESSCRIVQPEGDNVPNNSTEMKPQTLEGSCTVIQVGPDPTRISLCREEHQDSPEKNKSSKVAEICMVSQQLETTTTTVVVEVHQSEEDEINNAQSDASSTCVLTNSSSISSFTSSGANSLCSAISQELQRRSQRRASDSSLVHNPVNQSKMELVKCGLDKEKVEQHQQLMEEFKRAHRKMFAHTLVENNKMPSSTVVNGSSQQQKSKEERESFRLKRQQLEQQHVAKMDQERAALAVKERDIKLERDKQDMSEAEREMTRLVRRQHNTVPPPPPPLPSGDESDSHGKLSKCRLFIPPKAPPLPPSPPACPTPDYDTQSVTSETTVCKQNHSASVKPNNLKNGNKNHNSEFVEMQSLESFKLTNPAVVKPKPPATYFQQNPRQNSNRSSDSSIGSQVSLTTETVKPAITIREYPTNQERKNPSRFPFLPPPGNSATTNTPTSVTPNGNTAQMEESITSRLQNELTQTLSRANLKAKETQDNTSSSSPGNGNSSKTNVVTISINAQQNKSTKQQIANADSSTQNPPFYLFHNEKPKHNDRLIHELVNSGKQINANGLIDSNNKRVNSRNNLTDNNSTQRNSVTFNFGKTSKAESTTATKLGHAQPNGILKNGSANGNVSQVHIHNTAPPSNKPSVHKSIKFGGM